MTVAEAVGRALVGSGEARTTAPVGGRRSRLRSCVRPYLPAPSRKLWQGKGVENECAAPASVPTVSVPSPRIGVCSASHCAHSTETPGLCGPVSSTFRAASWLSARASQPVR